jgi:hypothetical protein
MNNEAVSNVPHSEQVEPTRSHRVYPPDVDIRETGQSIVLRSNSKTHGDGVPACGNAVTFDML